MQAGGGNVKIESRKLEWEVKPRTKMFNENYSGPQGGDKKVTAVCSVKFTVAVCRWHLLMCSVQCTILRKQCVVFMLAMSHVHFPCAAESVQCARCLHHICIIKNYPEYLLHFYNMSFKYI